MSTELNFGRKNGAPGSAVRWSLLGQADRVLPTRRAPTTSIPKERAWSVPRAPRLGDLLMLERGRNKAHLPGHLGRDPSSDLRGQFAVRCVDGRAPWEEELRQAEEQYSASRFGGPEPAPLWTPDYGRANEPPQASAIPRGRPGRSHRRSATRFRHRRSDFRARSTDLRRRYADSGHRFSADVQSFRCEPCGQSTGQDIWSTMQEWAWNSRKSGVETVRCWDTS